jgi:hypothetical protein
MARFRDLVTPVVIGDTILSRILQLSQDFVDEYKRCPTCDEMILQLGSLPGSEQERISKYSDRIRSLYHSPPQVGDDALENEVLGAVRSKQLEELLLEGGRMIDSGKVDYDRLAAGLRDVLAISSDNHLGTELNENIPQIINRVTSSEIYESIPTGIQGLDNVIGGWRKGQLACGMAASGVGKSTFLINHAVAAAMSGRNVMLLTVELADTAVIERVVRNIGKLDRQALQADKPFAEKWVGKFFRLTRSRFVVRYARPGRFSVEDMEAYLDRLAALTGFEPDIIFIDYLDEMRAGEFDRRKDTRHQHSGVTRDLIGVAKTRDLAVVTMTQTNRDAVGKKRLTMKDVGEDYGKIKQGDVTFALCQTDDEYRNWQARVRILKNRDGPGVGREIPVSVDYAKMLVRSLGSKGGHRDD